ncbi:MAG: DNA repair protein RecO, partial [Patescibacteria group bacterium]
KRRGIGEADRVLTVFTKEYGKLRLLAKGVRRISSRRAPHLELFSQVELTIHKGQTWDVISEASSNYLGNQLSNSLEKMTLAYFCGELVDRLLPEHQEHREIYYLLLDALNQIGKITRPDDWEPLAEAFANTLLWDLGYLPRSRRLTLLTLEPFIERLIEKKLRSWPLLTKLRSSV